MVRSAVVFISPRLVRNAAHLASPHGSIDPLEEGQYPASGGSRRRDNGEGEFAWCFGQDMGQQTATVQLEGHGYLALGQGPSGSGSVCFQAGDVAQVGLGRRDRDCRLAAAPQVHRQRGRIKGDRAGLRSGWRPRRRAQRDPRREAAAAQLSRRLRAPQEKTSVSRSDQRDRPPPPDRPPKPPDERPPPPIALKEECPPLKPPPPR